MVNKKIKMKKILLILLVFPMLFTTCKKEKTEKKYKTENVIIIVVDGARYSETWGDSTHQYIPYFSNEIAEFGIVNTAFYNNGKTSTIAGYVALTTGVYQELNNDGLELPIAPSIFQYLLKNPLLQRNAWIISSKDKLEVLGNCLNPDWKDKYMPLSDCGISGLGSGKRNDSLTLKKFFNILSEDTPKLTLLGFVEPDFSGHQNVWEDYLAGIENTDKSIYEIWEYINNDPYYSETTTLFITNDHGRHLDSNGGFQNHGDGCDGCRHINFFAYGPDFKKGIINIERELIDISATVSELLQFESEYVEGEIMHELFE